MQIDSARPVIISLVQYQDAVADGRLRVLDVVEKAHQLGVSGVELRREPWAAYRSELRFVRQHLEELGMIVTYATFSTLFSSDTRSQEMLLHDIETAYLLGSPILRVFPGQTPGDAADPVWDRAWEAVDYAAARGVTLALENYGKSPGGRLEEVLYVLNCMQAPALQSNIDIGNYATHGEDVPAAVRAIGARAVYAHLKDLTGPPDETTTYLGGGTLPLNAILAELDRLSQPMIYCFEFVSGDDPDDRIAKSLAYLDARRNGAVQ